VECLSRGPDLRRRISDHQAKAYCALDPKYTIKTANVPVVRQPARPAKSGSNSAVEFRRLFLNISALTLASHAFLQRREQAGAQRHPLSPQV
jgi:hypothetical protein